MFVYTEPELQSVEMKTGDDSFIVEICRPSFDQLLEVYQNSGAAISAAVKSADGSLPVDLARALCDLFVSVARGWQGVTDTKGTPLPFKADTLRSILEQHPELYLQAVRSINKTMAKEKRQEKNAMTSSGSAESWKNTPVK